jgi:hypothetical protein
MGQLAIPIAIASAATAAVVSYQGYQQAASNARAAGDYNRRVYEYRADVAEQDKEIIRRKNEQDKYYFDRDFNKYQSQTVVAYLKNGVSLEGGTPYKVLKQNYDDAQYSKDIMDYNASIGQKNAEDNALFERMTGSISQMNAYAQAQSYQYQAYSSLLTGAQKVGYYGSIA